MPVARCLATVPFGVMGYGWAWEYCKIACTAAHWHMLIMGRFVGADWYNNGVIAIYLVTALAAMGWAVFAMCWTVAIVVVIGRVVNDASPKNGGGVKTNTCHPNAELDHVYSVCSILAPASLIHFCSFT